jgi:hypothetical protein
MVPQPSLLLVLVDLIDPIPSPPVEPRRGRPAVYPDRLLPKALVLMSVRNVATVSGLLAILEQPTWEMHALRGRLTERGRFPTHQVAPRGYIISDDYYEWQGCAIAVHEFLAERKLPHRIWTQYAGQHVVIQKE